MSTERGRLPGLAAPKLNARVHELAEHLELGGIFFGLSYVCLFAAYYRARVTVVSPLVATESLWGVTLSVLLFKRTELVGARLLGAAILVVAGGTLISVFR